MTPKKIIDSYWFTPYGLKTPIGIVVAEDEDGRRQARIGAAVGIHQDEDESFILQTGAKFHLLHAEVLTRRLKAQELPIPRPACSTHNIKCHPVPFRAVVSGNKTFEVRVNDRPYQVGDVLHMSEWDPATETHTGAWTDQLVTYLMSGQYGWPPELVVMGIRTLAVKDV